MIYEFQGFIPVVHESAFVHPLAAVTGNVIIGRDVYIGPSAAIRGDWGGIVIADGCNVQENCTVHMFPGVTVRLHEGAHRRNCLVGMNAVVMDNVVIEEECIIGALCFVKADTRIPRRSLVVGNPGKIIRQISDEMIGWKTKGTALYQALPKQCHETLRECEPLREVPENRPSQARILEAWDELKKG